MTSWASGDGRRLEPSVACPIKLKEVLYANRSYTDRGDYRQ